MNRAVTEEERKNADAFHAPIQPNGQEVAVRSEAASLLEVISRAASDPATDVNKLERLLEMYERIKTAEAKRAYMDALAQVQTELPVLAERGAIKNREKQVQSTYALWEDINDAIKPVLQKHGFALSFRTGMDAQQITITGVLSHRDGHSEQTTIHLPTDTSGSKNAVQAVGSSVSYGKRYTASALLNLTSRGEDDDGLKAGKGGAISEDQAQTIRDLMESAKADVEKFCAFFTIAAVPDLPAKEFSRAVQMLNERRKALLKSEKPSTTK